MPGFVRQAQTHQRKQLEAELKEMVQPAARPAGASPHEDDLFVPADQAKDKAAKVVDRLRQEQTRRLSDLQTDMKRQLGQLEDNRLQRFYTGTGREGAKGPQITKGMTMPGRPKSKPKRAAARRRRRGLRAAGKEEKDVAASLITGLGVPTGEPGAALVGAAAHVAGGSFSLPVELPGGEVRMDFARPGGGAELSLWAVPTDLIHALTGTVTALVAAAVLLAAGKFWAVLRHGSGISPQRSFAYVMVVGLLWLLLGLIGALFAAVVILGIELARRAERRRRPGNA